MSALKASDAKICMDELVQTLQHYLPSKCGLRAAEVIKGGSLGQGTAVPGDFDLDVIVFSRDIHPANFTEHYTKALLRKFDDLLSQSFGNRYSKQGFTPHALQFTLTFTIKVHGVAVPQQLEIDLLPGPYFEYPEELYQHLKPLQPHERHRFTCCVAKWLMHFFDKQPNEVKEYIKRAKAWRNNVWSKDKNSQGRPKSILIALLVIKAYSDGAGNNPKAITANMIRYVEHHDQLRIHWTFDGATYDQKYVGYFKPPYIIDPCNPYNNMYDTAIGPYKANSPESNYEPGNGNWTVFVRNVRTMDLSEVDGTQS